MLHTRSVSSSTAIATALNISEHNKDSLNTVNAPKKGVATIINNSSRTISPVAKSQASFWNFSSILKTAIFAFLALGAESTTIASSDDRSDVCSLPSNHFINPYASQCPLEPPYNPCHSTHFLLQNSAEILDAKIIGIGERHGNRKATADCVEHLTNPGKKQIILFEAYPHGMEVPCSNKQILNKKGRTCIGWDTEEYAYESILRDKYDAIKEVFLNIVQNSYYKKFSDIDTLTKPLDDSLDITNEKIEQLIKVIIKNKFIPEQFNNLLEYMKIPVNINLGSLLITSIVHKAIIQQIKVLRKKETPYSVIASINPDQLDFNTLSYHCNQGSAKACKMYHSIEAERNKQFINEIKKHTDKNHQVIAIAGAAHFISDIGMYAHVKEIRSSVDYVRKELEKGADQNPYAILALNEFEMNALNSRSPSAIPLKRRL